MHLLGVFLFLNLTACGKHSLCAAKGPVVTRRYELDNVHTLITGMHMHVTLTADDKNSMTVSGPENMIRMFRWSLRKDTLKLETEKNCIFRDPDAALQIDIRLRDLRIVRNSGEYAIVSDGPLPFDSLVLISENAIDPSSPAVGDFDLEIRNTSLTVVSNNMSLFRLRGSTRSLFVGFYAGLSRFEGQDLQADRIGFIHKSANDMLFFPVHKIDGDLYSTGNAVLFHGPEIENIRRHYTGQIIRAY